MSKQKHKHKYDYLCLTKNNIYTYSFFDFKGFFSIFAFETPHFLNIHMWDLDLTTMNGLYDKTLRKMNSQIVAA